MDTVRVRMPVWPRSRTGRRLRARSGKVEQNLLVQVWPWELRASKSEEITLRRASGGEDRVSRRSLLAWSVGCSGHQESVFVRVKLAVVNCVGAAMTLCYIWP